MNVICSSTSTPWKFLEPPDLDFRTYIRSSGKRRYIIFGWTDKESKRGLANMTTLCLWGNDNFVQKTWQCTFEMCWACPVETCRKCTIHAINKQSHHQASYKNIRLLRSSATVPTMSTKEKHSSHPYVCTIALRVVVAHYIILYSFHFLDPQKKVLIQKMKLSSNL